MNLVLLQSCNSSQDLCYYVPALLQQQYVVLGVVKLFWNDKMRTPSTRPYNQLFTRCKCLFHITQKSVASQQKHALKNRFLQTLLCWNDNFNTGFDRITLNRKKKSCLDTLCFNYEQLFQPAQCTASRICLGSFIDKHFSWRASFILSFSDQLHYLRGLNCFGNGTRQCSFCLYHSWSSHILFSSTFLYCPL